MNRQDGVTYRGRGSEEPPASNAYSNYILLGKPIYEGTHIK